MVDPGSPAIDQKTIVVSIVVPVFAMLAVRRLGVIVEEVTDVQVEFWAGTST